MFLAIRMAIYVLAVPLAAYLGGSFDPETGTLCISVDATMSLAAGVGAAAVTFASSRWAKVKGWAT